jgi:hypothetical protein
MTIYTNGKRPGIRVVVYAFISARSGKIREQELSQIVPAVCLSNLRNRSDRSEELRLRISCRHKSGTLLCESPIISRYGELMHIFSQPPYPFHFPCVKLGNIGFNIQ